MDTDNMNKTQSFEIDETMTTNQTETDDLESSRERTLIINSPSSPNRTGKPTLRRSTRTKKRKRWASDEELEKNIDKSLEDKLQTCAKKKHISENDMKKLLKTVVENDHVLALVKIQEEQELTREKRQQEDNDDEEDDEANETSNVTEKFTRSKARELNRKPIPIGVLNEIEPGPEITALISDELHSDEDDEEYTPREEEYASDDDTNPANSDMDSQPCTPKTPATQGDPEDDLNISQYTDDGLFKVPRRRQESVSQPEEIIAKRTRSKVCLQETPIEAIESNFIPPDIPNDMLNFDAEIDNAWKEFLSDFSKPLNANVEEDDEADPEYVAENIIPIDKDELKDVNISKKELNDLVAELFDGLLQEGVFLDEIQVGSPKKSPDKSLPKKKTKQDSKSEFSSPVRPTEDSSKCREPSSPLIDPDLLILHGPRDQRSRANYNLDQTDFNRDIYLNETQTAGANDSQLQTTQFSHSQFIPNQFSTPNNQNVVAEDNAVAVLNAGAQQTIVAEGPATNATIPIQALYASAITPFEAIGKGSSGDQPGVFTLIPVTISYSDSSKDVLTLVPMSNSATTHGQVTSVMGGSTSYGDSRVVLTNINNSNTNKNTQVQRTAAKRIRYLNISKVSKNLTYSNDTTPPATQLHGIKAKTRPAPKAAPIGFTGDSYPMEKYCRVSVRKAFQKQSETLREIHITNEPTFAPNQQGFTELQRKLLEQQLRIHVQFIAQFFLQVYSHPILWKLAQGQRKMITELDNLYKEDPTSAFCIWNLKLAVKLMNDWEAELSVNSPENTALMEFIYAEVERCDNKHGFLQRFPSRIMKRMLQNLTFIYGHLLPQMPFKPKNAHVCEVIPALEQLIAHSISNTFEELEEAERRIRPNKPPKISVAMVCRQIAKSNIYKKSIDSFREYVGRRLKVKEYNAIKFVFEHRKAPPFKHILYDVDLENVRQLEDRLSEVPTIWREFGNRLKALELEKTTNPLGYHRALNAVRDFKDPEFDPYNPLRRASNQASNITIHVNCVYDSQQNTTNITTYNTYKEAAPVIKKVEAPIKKLQASQPEPPANQTVVSLPKSCENHVNLITNQPESYETPLPSTNLPESPENHPELLANLPESSARFPESSANLLETSTNQPELVASHVQLPINQSESPESQENVPLERKSEPKESKLEPRESNPGPLVTHLQSPPYFTHIHEPSFANISVDPIKIYNYAGNYDSESETRASDASRTSKVPEFTVEAVTSAVVPQTQHSVGFAAAVFVKPQVPKGQKLLTDYFKVEKRPPETSKKGPLNWRRNYHKIKLLKAQRQRRHFSNLLRRRTIRKRKIKRKIKKLLKLYRAQLYSLRKQYKNEHLARVFLAVKSLELYSELLADLKMFAKKMSAAESCAPKKATVPKALGDEEAPKPRKPYRVGESLRQMLLPESKEDANEKDAIFAMNFFDKVEETLCSAGQHERYEMFQNILKNFDCQKDRVADLYYRMEKLFMPDHSHLAEIFLSFLLPSEAIQIGKFFEHFMVTNMGSFVNKLNIFFNKQPAQIKKIYGALGELADMEDVSMEEVKGKILPLLKGNKFLIDWFLQSFETEKPSQSISNVYETVNLKQLESQQMEAEQFEVFQQKDFVEEPADVNSCQLKYINGGIYYGSRILLPAKLSFLATELFKREEDVVPEADERLVGITKPCVHGVRDYAERKLKAHMDKTDKEARIMDEEDKDKDKYVLCDDNTFKAHAARLNPALYEVPQTNASSSLKVKHSEGETSPKKQCIQKRRSPKKNLARSPTATAKKVTSIPESSKAVGIAKKLKTMTNGSDPETSGNPKARRKQPKLTKNTSNEAIDSSATHAGSDGAVSDSDKSTTVCEPKRKTPKLQVVSSSDELQQPISATISVCSQSDTVSSSPSPAPAEDRGTVWTRDEDKIILEEVKSGYDSETKLVTRIMAKLPRRTEAEIAGRHLFLMEVLTQLQGKADTRRERKDDA